METSQACRTLKNGKTQITGLQLIWTFVPGLVRAIQFAQSAYMKLLTVKLQRKILVNALHVVHAKACVLITQFYAIGYTRKH
jgi:hypothetical protein